MSKPKRSSGPSGEHKHPMLGVLATEVALEAWRGMAQAAHVTFSTWVRTRLWDAADRERGRPSGTTIAVSERDADKGKSVMIGVRVPQADREVWQQRAEAADLSFSDWVRSRLWDAYERESWRLQPSGRPRKHRKAS